MYDASQISKQLNISKVTAYTKMKLPEVKPFVISQKGKAFVDDKGLEAIKQTLKYNITSEETDTPTELESLKNDMIETLKNNIELLKEQLVVKETQIQDFKKLFETTQVLLQPDQEKGKTVPVLHETTKEPDIYLVNSLTQSLEKQKEKYKVEIEKENLQKKKGFFRRLLTRKKEYSID